MAGSQGRLWLNTAQGIQSDIHGVGLGKPTLKHDPEPQHQRSPLERFDELITHASLQNVSRGLFAGGHYSSAIEEAFKCLNNNVKQKSGLRDLDGVDLMRKAFRPDQPKLRFNSLRTASDRSEQQGYMEMYSGAISGIRNPRAHEHEWDDDPGTTLELLALANHLMNKLGSATRVRSRKRKT